MKICIADLLQCIDQIGRLAASANGKDHLYHSGTESVNLTHQSNCISMVENNRTVTRDRQMDDRITVHRVQQRTPEWHSTRDQAKVTGSTIHTAIGLR